MRSIDADALRKRIKAKNASNAMMRAMREECVAEIDDAPTIEPKTDEAAKRLNDLIFDINPAEICSQIESDNLRNWCSIIQTEMKMAMVKLPCWREGEA